MPWTTDRVTTERLVLRPFTDDDKQRIVEVMINSDAQRYLGGPLNTDDAASIHDATVGERWGSFCAADRHSDQMVGTVTFTRERGELEVTYQLHPDHWGQGLGTEMVTAALGWAAGATDDAEIIAVTQTANTASTTMLERLGFALESIFEEFDAEQAQYRRSLRR